MLFVLASNTTTTRWSLLLSRVLSCFTSPGFRADCFDLQTCWWIFAHEKFHNRNCEDAIVHHRLLNDAFDRLYPFIRRLHNVSADPIAKAVTWAINNKDLQNHSFIRDTNMQRWPIYVALKQHVHVEPDGDREWIEVRSSTIRNTSWECAAELCGASPESLPTMTLVSMPQLTSSQPVYLDMKLNHSRPHSFYLTLRSRLIVGRFDELAHIFLLLPLDILRRRKIKLASN